MSAELSDGAQAEIGGINGGHVDMQINAVEQGPGNPGLIRVGALGRLAAGLGRIVEMAATARVHGGDELNACRIGDVRISPGDGGAAGFQRLAESLQGAALEFRQFIEKQHAHMRQRHLAGFDAVAAADQRRCRRRMVGVPERPFRRQAAAL